ncbi:hypothetical protein [Halorhodospira halophila]|uniref:hypothetical protein n=1 Tax=Halorhodospira halophila TaxID=1053 RepID=UPI001911564A|nr:hypothetical protein [Halorhodospira halophila]MBK5942717.1 hypothetical protein [Halorhodospira halophila]
MARKPRPVREQERKAEELMAGLRGDDNGDTGDDTATAPESDETAGETGGEGAQNHPQADAATEPEGHSQGEGDTAGSSDLQAEYDRLRQAHDTLRGKYNSEVPRLQRELREATEERDRLREQLEQARSEQSGQDSKGNDSGISDERLEKIRQDFGEDFLEAVKLVAKQEIGPAQQDESSKVQEDVQRLEQRLQENDQQRFWRELSALCPQWETINQRQDWLQWLGEVDRLTGQTRQQLLDSAHQSLDAARVAEIFNAFVEQVDGARRQQKQSRQEELQSQVAPGKSRNPEPASSRPRYTVEDYTALQEEIRRGKWRGKEDEAKAKEREILQALHG